MNKKAGKRLIGSIPKIGIRPIIYGKERERRRIN
ncbi:hypothetical protein DFR80_10796 [Halanaerobium sp. ST460_2HS_T2]|jgi:hypothetical protein|uniref:Uncharacterized protein n=1 Tax=Halanaerobium kushneri TaxID=56779 RepID=A0A1N6ZK61_9FIRM|nr:hypothetical protein DFR80_10796 [Halanaerobium sp. ST460_2HS_T2]SIR27198.1 hypothetical protein SAMN05421834_11842 [Halanaerobium kushneri]